MRILVIGGTRFIGLATVRRLHAMGHTVAVFNRGVTPVELPPEITRISGDLKDIASHADALHGFAPDVVMHNMVLSEADAQAWVDLFGGRARLVMVSSMDVYSAYGRLTGIEPGDPIPVPMDEDAPLREVWYPYRAGAKDENDWLYHYDKIPAERVALAAKGIVLRLPMVYGENDGQHRLRQFVKPMLDGREAIVLDEGFAHWRSTFGYVENVAAAIALACVRERFSRVFNVGDFSMSMLDLGERVKRVLDWRGEFVLVPSDRLPEPLRVGLATAHHLDFDVRLIANELGYMPVVSTDDAIARTVAWERDTMPPDLNGAEMFHYAAQDEVLRG